MRVLLFGATGMVGQGALRECLQAADVEQVVAIGRTPTGQHHPKLRDLVHADLFNFASVAAQLEDFDACFFCVGVTSSRMSEPDYTRLTYDMTLAAANAVVALNPRMVFVYVSGAGADSSETSATMWERVRGRTENALLALPFRGVYIFRPGMIQPLDGIKSKTTAYRIFYSLMKPVLPLLRGAMPNHVLTTRQVGQAMLAVVRNGARKRVLESADIAALGRNATAP
ncbi:NAD(P)H-binding protein [Massilia pseudoviolaceinigra]|uniref:NAD(P)H-binding protein n=1 Tax=Massilia pseudoviolaceinigra TaxID=3057165 RepID=UPI0027967D88|nr:NAD(P)H-binding protein [Massilia sp. CCM 9206]MDQ1924479.1 NAD(P)H-binding protein [Massilia sp. CCM 9206]